MESATSQGEYDTGILRTVGQSYACNYRAQRGKTVKRSRLGSKVWNDSYEYNDDP